MAPSLHQVVLVRHGTTEWSLSGRHTGTTDIDLTPQGEADARAVGSSLSTGRFSAVWSSPRRRARRTAELAGLAGPPLVVRDDLAEWDYGSYEGLTSDQIEAENPAWSIWTAGGPDGESPAQVAARADRVVSELLAQEGDVAVFSHGHFGRALAVRWVGLDIAWGRAFRLDAGSVSVLGFEHGRRAITRWNQDPGS
ncbi:MAG: histidine phosphatase family protein [Acidimicrobiales bacterium]